MSNIKKIKSMAKVAYYVVLCTLLNPKGRGLDPYAVSPLKYKLTQLASRNKNSAVRLLISGKVTKVGYCGWLKRKARINRLNCLVFVRNKKTVEAVLIGPGDEIEKVVRAAWKGPSKAKVEKVNEKWFNKPRKVDFNKKRNEPEILNSWSQETVDLIRQAINYIGYAMKKPNEYTETKRVNGSNELMKAAQKRNLFVARFLRKEIYISSAQENIGFQRSQTTRVSSIVHPLIDHKQLAKDFLSAHGLPVPRGRLFNDYQTAHKFFLESKHPLVMKPAVGLNGSGVTVDIRTEDDFIAAWKYATEWHDQVIVEELIQGVDIRVIIIGGKARAAYIRMPANVVGDGVKNIELLIDEKNKQRLKNPHLRKSPVIPNAQTEGFLKRQGYSYRSVPPAGEIVFLHLKANISKGGDSINLNGLLHPDLMKLAEEAASVFGVDDYWGIDLMVERIDLPRDQQRCTIIELNSTANVEGVNYPFYGQRFNAAQALIDHLFPEETYDESYPLQNIKVKVTGILDQTFFEYVRICAQELKLNGYIQPMDSTVEINLSGRRHHLLYFLDQISGWKGNNGCVVDGFRVWDYKGPQIKEGFVLKEDPGNKEAQHDQQPASGFSVGQIPHAKYYDATNSHHERRYDLNTLLFIEEFERRGYQAEPPYEALIKIKKDEVSGITGMRYSSLFCDKVCDNLYPVKKLLAFHGFPVARGVRFKCGEKTKIQNYYEQLNGSLVVTSLHPQGFKTCKIKDIKRLDSFRAKARNKGTNYLLLEEYVEGWHICIGVIAGKAVGAMVIEPTSVLGDGSSSIIQLIEEKNKLRAENPWYQDKIISIDKSLEKHLRSVGYQLEDVPEPKEKIFLEDEIGLELGGETVGIDDLLHADFKEQAIQAVAAIPGLEFAVVHMIIPAPDRPVGDQSWVIKKIDTNPSVAVFHFPWRGEPSNMVEPVVTDLCLTDRTRWMK